MTDACRLTLGTDVQACIGQMVGDLLNPLLAHFWWLAYWPWAVAAIIVLIVLWVLSLVRQDFGSGGVTVVLVALAAGWGYLRGRQNKSLFPTELLPHAPPGKPAPKVTLRPRVPVKR